MLFTKRFCSLVFPLGKIEVAGAIFGICFGDLQFRLGLFYLLLVFLVFKDCYHLISLNRIADIDKKLFKPAGSFRRSRTS